MRSLLRFASLLILAVLAPAASAGAAPTVEVGTGFACSITSTSGAVCWGANDSGQLGGGTVGGWSLVPVQVSGLTSGVVDLAAGSDNACAALTDGSVKCWGDNSQATLGSAPGAPSLSSTPVTIPGISGATRVTVGGFGSACAIVAGGVVKCWGYNLGAALGVGSGANYLATPTAVVGLPAGATEIAHSGRHGCAVVSGALYCWGYNDGQPTGGVIASGSTVSYNSAQPVSGLASGVANVAVSYQHTCVVTTAGAVRCWGEGDTGSNGDGTYNDRVPPGVTPIASGASSVSVGSATACANVGGAARCWGYNYYGTVGVGTFNYSYNTPQALGLESGVGSISAGGHSACAIHGETLKCWGDRGLGVIGDGTGEGSATPFTVPGTGGASRVATGNGHSCAVLVITMSCWGSNSSQQLGEGSGLQRWSPVPATTFNAIGAVQRVAIADATTCARVSIGGNATFRCTGSDWLGQLGDGDEDDSDPAGTVTNPGGFTTLAEHVMAGNRTFCHTRNAVLYCWGDNYESLLGRNLAYASLASDDDPASPTGLTSNMRAVSIGASHACAVQSTTLYCWGRNGSGQVNGSPGSPTIANAPVSTGITNADVGEKDVAVGDLATCVIVTGSPKRIRCFGYGGVGQMGNGSFNNQTTAVSVVDSSLSPLGAPQMLDSAGGTFCAIDDSRVKCWGAGGDGALGTGSFGDSPVAVTVPGTEGATDIDGHSNHFCAVVSGEVKCWGVGTYGQLGNMSAYGVSVPAVATTVTAAIFPPAPPPSTTTSRARFSLKLTGKVRRSGRSIKAPLQLRFKVPAGFTSRQACALRPTISVATSKKKTAKLKVKFKAAKGYCTFKGSIKLPKSFKGKKKRFTVKAAAGAATRATTYKKTLKLK